MHSKFKLFYQSSRSWYLLVLSLFAVSTISAQWAQKTSLPAARDGALCFVIGSRIYCGGGEGKKDFRAYDPATNTWTLKASLPGVVTERAFGVGLCINGKGYVGLGSDGNTALTDWWEYDTAANAWTQKASYPVGRNACGYFVVNNKAYVCGGTDNTYIYGQCYEYDPLADQWTQKASYPLGAICFPFCFAVNGKGYFSGGAASTDVSNTYEYDPLLNTWTIKAPFPISPRQAGVSFVINNVAYCGLGMYNYSVPYKQFFTYDPAMDLWDTLNPQNISIAARAWPSAAALNNKAYVGLGWDLGGTFYSDWWELTVGGTSTVVATAIKRNEQESNPIAVYPNPFSESLSLDHAAPGTQIEVYNAVGALVFKQYVDRQVQINSSGWTPGVYMVKTKMEDRLLAKKVLKE